MASGLSLQDILGAPNLTGLIQTTKSGIPNPFPDEFYTVDNKVFGNQATYFKADGTRETATITSYGGAPNTVQQRSLANQPVVLAHSYEELNLNPLIYQSLFDYGNLTRQKMGAQEVQRQIREFKKRLANLRIAVMVTTLFNGTISFDGKGNFLPPGASVPANGTAINWGYPTNGNTPAVGTPSNIGTAVDPLGTGTAIIGSAAASWATSSTDITKQVNALKQAAVFLTGFEIANAFYGKGVPSLLANNTQTQTFMARDTVVYMGGNAPSGPAFIKSGEIPDGTLGLKWHKSYQSFFKDQNGVLQPLVADNQILFTPDYSTDWLSVYEGSYAVPQRVWEKLPEDDAMNNIDQVFGMFAYSLQSLKPPTATIIAGDTFIPVFKNPLTCFSVTVA